MGSSGDHMTRAVVIHAPHDIRIDELEIPELGAQDVLLRVGAGGICGSDLHYYHEGGFGVVRLKEPLVLGHEVSGTVVSIGQKVKLVQPGMRVAINPSKPCRVCRSCLEGQSNHCIDMRFYGSAMRFPHVQGAFREQLVVHETQTVPVSDTMTLGIAAIAEPLAVGLHAIQQAGPIMGKRVLVTGCGPIGALLIGALRRAGAVEIVAIDIARSALDCVLKMGADRAIHSVNEADILNDYTQNGGTFDLLFEASGNEKALLAALPALRPRGIVVTIGLGGEMTLPMNMLVTREINLRGSFRFGEEFVQAVKFLDHGLIEVQPVLTATFPFDRASEAFELASDRSRAMKVQLSFE
jgi:L-idonate 5-dehydrogenase